MSHNIIITNPAAIVVQSKGGKTTAISSPTGSATRLVELADVRSNTASDGEVLTYVAANGDFEFQPQASASATDQTARDIANGAFLQANNAYANANTAIYTAAQIRANISNTTPIQYDSVTGIISHALSGVGATTYGNTTFVPTITVDAKGHVTAITNTAIALPSGSDQFARDHANAAFNQANSALTLATTANTVAASAYGKANIATTNADAAFAHANAAYANANTAIYTASQIRANITNTAPINYDATTGTVSHALSGVGATTYGNTTFVPTITVNDKGHVTSVVNTAIAFPASVDDFARAHANAAFNQANTATTVAASAYSQANIATSNADAAFTRANNAYANANTAIYTAAQIRANISNTAPINYDATTGIISHVDSGVVASGYGDAATVPKVVVDAKGHVTSVTNTTIAISAAAITSGTLAVARGGTGQTAITVNGSLLIGNTVSGGYDVNTLTQGTGIVITNDKGSVTITATGGAATDQFARDTANGAFTKANGAVQFGFPTINVATPGQANVVASTNNDTLILSPGTGIAFTTDNPTKTITITATGGSATDQFARDQANAAFTKANTANVTGQAAFDKANSAIYTAAQIRANISNTTPINYDATTGIISHADSGVVATTYGNTAFAPSVTVDAKGHITAVVNTAIALDAAAITSGTLAVARGGTGQTTYANGDLLIGNTISGGLDKANLTQGYGIIITNSNGRITLDATIGKTYYLVLSQDGGVATYNVASILPSASAEVNTSAIFTGTSYSLTASFLTAAGEPGTTLLPAGTYGRHFHATTDGVNNEAQLRVDLYKYAANTLETLLRTNESPIFNSSDAAALLLNWNITDPTSHELAETDRLLFKVYARRVSGGSGSVRVTVFYEGVSRASYIPTTILTGGADAFARLQANAAYTRANTANTTGQAAFDQANAAYTRANTANTTGQAAFDQANAAYTRANTANTVAASAYNQANIATTNADAAFAKANTAIYTAAQIRANISNTYPVYYNATTGVVSFVPATANGQTLIGNTVSGTFDVATFTQGTGIVITNDKGSVTVASSANTTYTNTAFARANTFVYTTDYPTFQAAVAAALISGNTILVCSNSQCTSTTTVPANVGLIFVNNGMIALDTGVTVTCNGTITAEATKIFTGGGTFVAGPSSAVAKYPQWWGAVANGVQDCTTAFNAAAVRGGHIVVPGGRYLLTSQVTVEANSHWDMARDAILDFSTSPATTIFFFGTGTEDTANTLTSNGVEGTNTVTITSATVYANGDLVRISSATLFDSFSTSVAIGEINQVNVAVGTTVTLETKLKGTYTTAATATISRIHPLKNLHISGGQFIGGGTLDPFGADLDHTGIAIYLGDNILIEGSTFYRCDIKGIWLRDTINSQVRNCKFEEAMNDSQAYGVSVDNACQEVLITNNHFRSMRHAFSQNNSGATRGIPRRIIFSHNTVYDSAKSRAGGGGDAIDTHTAAEDIHILYNLMYEASGQGINFECRSGSIVGNKIYGAWDNGIAYHNESDLTGSILIQGNEVHNAGGAGIKVTTPIRGSLANVGSAIVTGNRVVSPGATGIWINNATLQPAQVRGVVLSDNLVEGCVTGSSILLDTIQYSSVIGNIIHEPVILSTYNIRLNDCKYCTVQSNIIRLLPAQASAGGIYINSTVASASEQVIVRDNIVSGPDPVGSRGIFLDADSANVRIFGNSFEGTTTPYNTDYTTRIIAAGVVTISGDCGGSLNIDTEGAAAADDLDTITGGFEQQLLVLRTLTATRDVTIKHNTGNIRLDGATDKILGSAVDSITLIKRGGTWQQVAYSNNAGAIVFSAAQITTGILAVARGGTGKVATGLVNGSILIGNTVNTGFDLTTIAQSAPVIVTNDKGTITLSHARSGVTATGYGDAVTIPVFVVDANGHLTSVTNTAITGLSTSVLTTGILPVARGGTGKDASGLVNGAILIGNTVNTGFDLTTIAQTAPVIVVNGKGTVTLSHASSGVTSGTYGGSNRVIGYTVDQFGHVTTASNVAIDLLPASAITTGILAVARGGTGKDATGLVNGQILIANTVNTGFDLAGITQTAPVIVSTDKGSIRVSHARSGVTAGSYGSSTLIPVITVDDNGHITTATTSAASGLPAATANGQTLIGNTVSGSFDVALIAQSAPVIVTNGKGTITLSHARSGVSPATYGSGTLVPVITVDANGHITTATTAAITGTGAILHQTELDFGATPIDENEFTVTDASISAAALITGSIAYKAPTGKDLDEVTMDTFTLSFAPGTGQFTVYAKSLEGYVVGKFFLNYTIY
jgi:hypothetical protein